MRWSVYLAVSQTYGEEELVWHLERGPCIPSPLSMWVGVIGVVCEVTIFQPHLSSPSNDTQPPSTPTALPPISSLSLFPSLLSVCQAGCWPCAPWAPSWTGWPSLISVCT